MNWFRKHLKHGSRLALLALAIQFVLSFGHFHEAAAQNVQIGLSDAGPRNRPRLLRPAKRYSTNSLLITIMTGTQPTPA